MSKYIIIVFAVLLVSISGCKKEFLDEKPNTNITIPKTLDDLRKLLDNSEVMNMTGKFGVLSGDEYYVTDEVLSSLEPSEYNAYIWKRNFYEGFTTDVEEWNAPYRQIFITNIVLAGLENINRIAANTALWDEVKGTALFFRSFAYFQLAQTFCKVYNAQSADTDLGVPIRTSANVDELQERATLQKTYDQIINDAAESATLLDPKVAATRNRPSRPAAYALLSRIYLNMKDYVNAEKYAKLSLQLHNKLINYNTVSKTSTTPFDRNNIELLVSYFQNNSGGLLAYSLDYSIIDASLYNSYLSTDLRKVLFIRLSNGLPYIKRGYYGTKGFPFSGLAVDEMYVTLAECLARNNKFSEGIDTLNSLLKTRHETNKYINYTAGTKEAALNIILTERKKELIFRGQRLPDIKRLNVEGAGIIIRRTVNGQQIELPVNDPRYLMPIPPKEIGFSQLIQNPR